MDRLLDEVSRGRCEYRPPFLSVGIQQIGSGPALQGRGKLPAEIGDVFEAGVYAVAAIGRMAVRCVAGDEDAPDAILI